MKKGPGLDQSLNENPSENIDKALRKKKIERKRTRDNKYEKKHKKSQLRNKDTLKENSGDQQVFGGNKQFSKKQKAVESPDKKFSKKQKKTNLEATLSPKKHKKIKSAQNLTPKPKSGSTKKVPIDMKLLKSDQASEKLEKLSQEELIKLSQKIRKKLEKKKLKLSANAKDGLKKKSSLPTSEKNLNKQSKTQHAATPQTPDEITNDTQENSFAEMKTEKVDKISKKKLKKQLKLKKKELEKISTESVSPTVNEVKETAPKSAKKVSRLVKVKGKNKFSESKSANLDVKSKNSRLSTEKKPISVDDIQSRIKEIEARGTLSKSAKRKLGKFKALLKLQGGNAIKEVTNQLPIRIVEQQIEKSGTKTVQNRENKIKESQVILGNERDESADNITNSVQEANGKTEPMKKQKNKKKKKNKDLGLDDFKVEVVKKEGKQKRKKKSSEDKIEEVSTDNSKTPDQSEIDDLLERPFKKNNLQNNNSKIKKGKNHAEAEKENALSKKRKLENDVNDAELTSKKKKKKRNVPKTEKKAENHLKTESKKKKKRRQLEDEKFENQNDEMESATQTKKKRRESEESSEIIKNSETEAPKSPKKAGLKTKCSAVKNVEAVESSMAENCFEVVGFSEESANTTEKDNDVELDSNESEEPAEDDETDQNEENEPPTQLTGVGNLINEDLKKLANKTSNNQTPKKKRFVLFVGNLAFNATTVDVKKHFLTKVHKVVDVRIPRSRDTNLQKGFGYVEVENQEDFERALGMHNTFLSGKKIRVEYTTSGSKRVWNKQEVVGKNKKLHAMRKAGKLAGSQKINNSRSFRRKVQKGGVAEPNFAKKQEN